MLLVFGPMVENYMYVVGLYGEAVSPSQVFSNVFSRSIKWEPWHK